MKRAVALVLQNIWGQDLIFADLTVALMVPNTAAWMGLRTLLGLCLAASASL